MENNGLVYDVSTIPDGKSMNDIYYAYTEHKFLFYDSSGGGNKPYFLRTGASSKFFIDISNPDGKELFEMKMKEMKDEK